MYTMKQTCKKVGMTYEALKFYCNEGLVPNVKRDFNNRRVFDESDVLWITSLKCLKNCGMSINDMKSYIDLCMQGQSSIPERKIILNELKESLKKKMDDLEASIDYIDQKQQFYDDVLSGKTKYLSNLITVEDEGGLCHGKEL
jgi:DNA-binding transcriptional MerR regulator